MHTPTTIELEHRIIALENTARRWRRISIAIILCSAAGLLVAADSAGSASDEIRTKKLVLLDQQGRALGDLSSEKGKFAGLKFYNPETKAIVAAIGINLDGTGFLQTRTMLLVDEQGRTVGDLLYAKDRASGLRFYNPDTKFCVSGFGLGADGSGAEYLNTREGKQVIIHTGAVNEKGVPLEEVQKALDLLRRTAIP